MVIVKSEIVGAVVSITIFFDPPNEVPPPNAGKVKLTPLPALSAIVPAPKESAAVELLSKSPVVSVAWTE
ncbi:hypothetical protein D3C87_1419230 [compost metagenome]